METVIIGPELDNNVLLSPKSERERGEHGWFTGGSHSFDHLLNYPVVRDWIDSYTAESTRSHKLYQFQKVLLAARLKDPSDLLKLSDSEAKSLVKRVAQFYLQKEKPTWARGIVITMRGFYEAHDRELKFKRSERIRTPASKKRAVEYVPTSSDAYRMADVSGSKRNKAAILSLFQSGVRVGCLCNWTYGMVEKQLFPEVKVPVEIKVTPGMDSKLNLYRLPYYVTFLHEEAAQALRDYLEERKEKGWKPKPNDPVFVTESSASQGEPWTPGNVWEIIKRSAELAELKPESIWTHCLRKSFRKVLNSSPIDEDTKEALMGHKLPGSRGSYFDYHDTDEVAEKYLQANFARNGNGNRRITVLEAQNKQLREELDQLKASVRNELRSIRAEYEAALPKGFGRRKAKTGS